MSGALDSLSLRQRVIADNVANVQTPGFQARRVQFEQALSSAVGDGSGRVQAKVLTSLEPTRENGNNVNLDTEVLSNIDTNLRFQLATRAMDGKFSAIRTALRSN
nr:flagellar basal body protein [Demequina sp. TTPB684]